VITELNELGQPVIQLTQDDYNNCLKIVDLMLEASERLNFKNSKYNMNPKQAYAVSFCGVLGEQAVAKYFDYDYSYLGYDPKRNDVLGYEVRATYYPTGRLLTHPVEQRNHDIGGDKPGRYILVTIEQNILRATIRGYSTLWRCNERKSNWDTSLRWPCFAMPQNQLWPIDMLPATDELIKHQTAKAA
jgi:hypothetical protein